jgi:hypothetical protein
VRHGLLNLLVSRVAAVGGTQHGLHRNAAAQVDAEQRVQAANDLAVRQAGFFVERDDCGLGVRAYLGGGGSQRVGGLQGMPPLDASAALAAATDMNVELPMNRLAGNFDLELRLDVGFLEGAAAPMAGLRQQGFQGFVDLLGRGRLAMGFLAVSGAGLAARLLGVGRGRFLGEGSRLTLAGTLGFFQLLRQGRHARFKFRDALPELGTLGTHGLDHPSRLAKNGQRSCAPFAHAARLNRWRR